MEDPLSQPQPQSQSPVEASGKTRTRMPKFLIPVIGLSIGALLLGLVFALFGTRYLPGPGQPGPGQPPSTPVISEKITFKKFASEEEFKLYIQEAAESLAGGFTGISPSLMVEERDIGAPGAMDGVGGGGPTRVSETTVQVKGIDEPDIVKTDGQEIYVSTDRPYYRPIPMPVIEGMIPPPDLRGETKVIKGFPPADLAKEAGIPKFGDLLLHKDILVVLAQDNEIVGYDVSDPKFPVEKWKIELKSNNSVVSARLFDGEIYLVTQGRVGFDKPCPIVPLRIGGEDYSIACTNIYYPIVSVPIDVIFTAFKINPLNGELKRDVSFVGSSGNSVIYMSPNSLYVTYTYYVDMIEFLYDFYLRKGEGLVPGSLLERLRKLKDYDLSNQAKMIEFQTLYEQYLSSLDKDERLRIENEFENRMQDYMNEHVRDFEKTGVVKIGLNKFDILSTGSFPGQPLNQFSLDEYESFLRVATTVGGARFWGTGESANDIYVFDRNLRVVGSVKDLGLTERIYSARFIEDKGYLVTFRQIDPFYVLDLSKPSNPEVKGELKIPGYSSYLHPIAKNKILGIGKEGSQVKMSLFDVSSTADPKESSKYLLDESWSDVLNTHHAFLLDTDHLVFFLPGSRGGYVFSYRNDQLEMKKAVADIQARRAIYINDYLYIIGEEKIVVLNEVDWEKVNELTF